MDLFFLCLKVFFCRIIDMSLASLRTVYTVKGKSYTVAMISLVEGLVYFLIVKEALNYISSDFIENLYIALAYSGGFSMGTFLGSKLASKLAGGMIQAQVVMTSKNDEIIKKIQDAGYALTVIKSEATSFSGEKYMIFSEIKHSKLKDFKELVHSLDEKAFVMVNETKYVFNGFIKR